LIGTYLAGTSVLRRGLRGDRRGSENLLEMLPVSMYDGCVHERSGCGGGENPHGKIE
jgi:hypothetical protein